MNTNSQGNNNNYKPNYSHKIFFTMSSTEDIQYSQHVDGLMNVDDQNDSSISYDNRSKRQVVENLSDQDIDAISSIFQMNTSK